MKTSALLLVAACLLAACKKDVVVTPETAPATQSPVTAPPQVVTQSNPSANGNTIVVAADTIPDNAVLKIKLVKDNVNYDETIILFDHTAGTLYNNDYDAPYLQGYGQESLASISSDGRDLVVNMLPYSKGMSVGLNVNAKADGAFVLQVSYKKDIPANMQLFVKDRYLNDSLDMCTGPYKFNIVKADTASFGVSRFKLVLRPKAR